ncbi:MAG: DUF5606 domain-containing protein [Thermoflavifilum sp.]|nr:DUF5606 domain-containing protein [Thermoflavifilum sp.]
MAYKDIVSISGLPGLYEMLSSKAEGGIVRSLQDKSTRFVSARLHRFTPIETIEVFTTGANVPLAGVFKAMQAQEDKHPIPDSSKANEKALREYFDQVFPELDDQRVYLSDLKKMVRWYMQLKEHNLLPVYTTPEEPSEQGTSASTTNVSLEETAEPGSQTSSSKSKSTRSRKKKNTE